MGRSEQSERSSFFIPKGALSHRVGASCISLAPPQAAGLAHSAAPPFPTKRTSLALCGSPWRFGGGTAAVGGSRALLRRAADNQKA